MSEQSMVERVAKAIYDAANKEDYVSDYRFHGGDTCLDGQFSLDNFARAAIAAMREPTEAMIDNAAYNVLEPPCDDCSGGEPLTMTGAKAAWQFMIDAALK